MKKFIFFIILLVFLTPKIVYSMESSDYSSNILNNLNLEKYDSKVEGLIGENDFDISFSSLVKDIILGKNEKFSFFNILNYIIKIVFKEAFLNSKIIKNIIIITILCAFLNAFTESFKNKGVNETAFYAGYMVISILLINSFNLAIAIILETIMNVSSLINSLIPVLIGVLVMSGASASAAIFSGFIATAMNIVIFILKNVFIPLMSSIVILNIINHISSKEVLSKLIDFLKWLVTFGLRTSAVLLAFIMSLQRVSSPILNSTLNKTVKTFINFVPFIGDAMNSAIDGAMHFIGLIKGGVGMAIVIFIIISALIPVVKLFSFIIIYKITAILIEPISDRRITHCIDSVGEYTKMILSTLVLFIFLFIIFIVVMLTISG